MARNKRKKLNLKTKKYFQKWLLVRISGIILSCSLVAAVILYFYARSEVTGSFFDAHVKIRRVSDLLLPVIVAGSFVSLISGIVISLFIPQQIAGPIFRIEQDLKPLQKGDLTSQVRLRNNDILQEFAAEVNETAQQLCLRVQRCKDTVKELEELLGESGDDALRKKILELQSHLSRLKTNG